MEAGEDFAKRIEEEAEPLKYEVKDVQTVSAAKNWRANTEPTTPDTKPLTINTMIRAKGKEFVFDDAGNRRLKVIYGYISLRFQNPALTLDYQCDWKSAWYRIRNMDFKPSREPKYIKFRAVYDH